MPMRMGIEAEENAYKAVLRNPDTATALQELMSHGLSADLLGALAEALQQ